MTLDVETLCVPLALRPFAEFHLQSSEPVRAIANLLLLDGMAQRVNQTELAACALALRKTAPTDNLVWQQTGRILNAGLPDWHWRMVNDQPRNNAYERAINAQVRPGMTVLEIGTGSGLLAMMAARAGAAHVYSIELNAAMVATARQCIARNGLADKVTVIHASSHNVRIGRDLPARCDLLVHEVLSTSVLNEGVIPAVTHARDDLLVPHAPLLPERVWASGALSDHDLARERIDGSISGFDLRDLNTLIPAEQAIPARPVAEAMSNPAVLAEFDLRAVDAAHSGAKETVLTSNRQGTATGIEQWLGLGFSGGDVFEATNPQSNWGRRLYAFAEPLNVQPGARVSVRTEWVPTRLAVSLDQA